MNFAAELKHALFLIFTGDADLWEIILLSLKVSFTALLLASILGIATALIISVTNFWGKNALILLLNALMSLPPVFIGLLLYMVFSHSGALGWLQWLYTPKIMICAQALLIFPIVTALAVNEFTLHYQKLCPFLDNLAAPMLTRISCLLHQMRLRLMVLLAAGLGRALSEVGAVIIVGGNINHVTRTMTTAIVLETSQGNLGFAFGLGLVLLSIGLFVNILLFLLHRRLQWY